MTFRANPATQAVRAAIESDTQHGAVVPPLHLSSNFAFAGFGEKRQYDYTRSGNPTRDALADALTALEGGAGAVVTSSGMAALTLLCQLLEPGDLLIAPHDCYGGTYRLFQNLSAKGHFDVQFVDQTNSAALRRACELNPRIILVETPSNPLLRIVDIAAVSALAKQSGALLAVDNTFLSPALQQPISLGADLVLHSTTKYINGHSDVVGGSVVAATDELAEQLNFWSNCLGITGAPFDSYLTLRGIRTLHTRMKQHEETANLLADLLQQHAGVDRVYYPGLKSHPGHDIAARQQSGFGGMISFEIGGGEAAVRAFVNHLQYFSLAESLGGVESLVCHPPSMTHAPVSEKALAEAGIRDNLIRLSVGLESAEDLAADVLAALEAARLAVSLKPVAVAAGA
ncbi:MAG: cystathionine gamma-synthase [Gammaproteobacteria bacterium]|nr:cystathionine gamma-synthase [Gammaproteobacteria bacterium]MDH3429031.1 cystathionine gamma-synthase [Gammaproteobacteria bacterium]MDH3433958.1 cystathionine gamma-synthase [Gammaproteobacteria bacterium]